MKNILNCLVLLIAVSSCSKIELNNDSIIGIWENTVKSVSSTGKTSLTKEEWIFNDANLGKYHGFDSEDEIIYLTDFKWSVEGGIYTITYPGTDLPSNQVRMIADENGAQLVKVTGDSFAYKLN